MNYIKEPVEDYVVKDDFSDIGIGKGVNSTDVNDIDINEPYIFKRLPFLNPFLNLSSFEIISNKYALSLIACNSLFIIHSSVCFGVNPTSLLLL